MVKSFLVGMLIAGYFMAMVAFFLFYENHIQPKIMDWIYRRSEKRLVASGHFTPKEAHEMTEKWRREREGKIDD